jgi:hypothetical protein
MQQIRIPNITANDPAITMISPINAGIVVAVDNCCCIIF